MLASSGSFVLVNIKQATVKSLDNVGNILGMDTIAVNVGYPFYGLHIYLSITKYPSELKSPKLLTQILLTLVTVDVAYYV